MNALCARPFPAVSLGVGRVCAGRHLVHSDRRRSHPPSGDYPIGPSFSVRVRSQPQRFGGDQHGICPHSMAPDSRVLASWSMVDLPGEERGGLVAVEASSVGVVSDLVPGEHRGKTIHVADFHPPQLEAARVPTVRRARQGGLSQKDEPRAAVRLVRHRRRRRRKRIPDRPERLLFSAT
jgi:hypothetical protein